MELNLDINIDSMQLLKFRPPSSSDNVSSKESNEQFYSFALYKGCRKSMLDRVKIDNDQNKYIFSLFDGHGSNQIVKYLENNYHKSIFNDAFSNHQKIYKKIDDFVCKMKLPNIGSTSISLILENQKARLINLGDSKIIAITKDFKVKQLHFQHNPYQDSERQRIQKIGGWILPIGNTLRVQGTLSVTRSFGDYNLKPYISSQPEIIDFSIQDIDFLIMATDGFWNEISEKEIQTFFKENQDKNFSIQLIDLLRRSKGKLLDNVAIIIIDLKQYLSGSQLNFI